MERFEPLDDLALAAIALLLRGISVLRAVLPAGSAQSESVDLAGLDQPSTTPVTAGLNSLSRALVAYVFAPRPVTAAAERALVQAMRDAEAAQRFPAGPIGREPFPLFGTEQRDANLEVNELLRIAGFAGHDRFCRLHASGGATGLAWRPVPHTSAIGVLVEKLYRRVEFFARQDRLGSLELDATMWYFRSHGKEPDGPALLRGQLYRMGDWCLVERRTLAFRTSFLEAFIGHEAFQHLTPREQNIARGLLRRVAGVFEVVRELEHGFEVRDLVTQNQFDILDRGRELGAGDVVLGSLIPFDSAWLISFGSLNLRAASPDRVRQIVDAFQVQHDRVPADIRLEMLIAFTFDHVAKELNDLPPFASAAEARRTEAEMMVALAEAGFCDTPPGWEPTRGPDGSILDVFEPLVMTDPALLANLDPTFVERRKLDVPITAWLQATRKIVVEGAGGSRQPAAGRERAAPTQSKQGRRHPERSAAQAVQPDETQGAPPTRAGKKSMSDSLTDGLEDLVDELVGAPGRCVPMHAMEQLLAAGTAAVEPLVDLLREGDTEGADDSDDDAAAWAAVVLGQMRAAASAADLAAAIQRSRPHSLHLPIAAAEALAAIGAPALPPLRALAASDQRHHRLWAYYAAGRMQERDAYDFLIGALTADRELADVVAMALGDYGDAAAIEPLHRALAVVEPWQRKDLEDAIVDLHRRTGREDTEPADWRLRYRLNLLHGRFPMSWAVVLAVADAHGFRSVRPAPPLRSLEAILASAAAEQRERCDCCGAETWRSTGVPVCPRTAASIAGLQALQLGNRRDETGIEDIFDMLDELEADLLESATEPDAVSRRARERQEYHRGQLQIMHAAAIWAAERGADTVDGACTLLRAEGVRMAQQYGDPEGVFGPARPSAPRTAP